eukprot:s420_g12.t1
MARKKRTGPPGKQHGRPVQAKPCPLHEQIQSGRSLSEFVKLEFERGGATFNQEGLSSELLQLLQDVKLVERPGTQHNPGRAPLGLCQQTLPQLLAHVRRRFNLRLAEDVLSTVQWQQLHSILGDRCLCNMFYTYQVFLCVGGSRWLQLTGYWKATNPTEGVGVVKSKPWTPSEIIIKRHILHVAKFTARAGLPHSSPLRKIILKEGADEAGAKRFIWWILSPKFHHLDVPPPLDASVAPLPQRAKRQRGKRKHKGQQPPNEDQERAAKHTKIAPAEKHVPSLQREVLFEALMEPVLHMLKKTPSVNFQELLSKHSPSHRALLILKVFEQKNQRLGDHALPSICGLRCSCHSRRPKAKVSKETRARSGNLFQCTGVAQMALGWLWWHSWSPLVAVAPRLFCVVGTALGDTHLRLAWQAWRHLRGFCVLGRRWCAATLLHCSVQAWHVVTFCVAGVALEAIYVTFAGRRGTDGTGLALVARLVAADRCGAAALLRGRRGPWWHLPSGVALGDIHVTFVWQARPFRHWLALVAALVTFGRPWSPWAPLSVESVALGDICLPFVWQTRHLVTSTSLLWRGAYRSGLALVAALGRPWSLWAPRLFYVAGVALGDICLPFAWQVALGDIHITLSPWAPRLFCMAGVALGDICLPFVWQAWRLRHWAGSGGPAEIRFMRDFPALSCAASGQQVARFLCAALKELLDLELVGKKNWVKLVTKQSSIVKN